MKNSSVLSYPLIAAAVLLPLASAAFAAEKPAATVATGWTKPAWLTDLSGGVKEGYDDNLLMVSGDGMSKQDSFITTLSPKVGFNFAPLLGKQKNLSTLSLVYAPDFNFYQNATAESFNAHKVANAIKGKTGDFSFALDNAFLFNDGETAAPIYSGNDSKRSAYATGAPRERRRQIQDRSTIVLQYDLGQFFVRPVASMTYYDLMTDWHRSAGAYTGYQNYVDRADVNGGLDLGYKVVTNLAVTVGYRYGHQYQQALPNAINSLQVHGQQAQSTADYQRLLLGLEGKPVKWLTVKLAGGPEFRDYNSAAPVNDDTPINYYGEASVVATLTATQSLAFAYRHWQWVSSTGSIPYADSSYSLTYHWSVTKQLGLDLTGKYADADYSSGGSSTLSGGSSLRDDAMYSVGLGVSYAFTKHLNGTLGYAYDFGRNQQDNVGALVGFREFDHQLVSLGVNYKF